MIVSFLLIVFITIILHSFIKNYILNKNKKYNFLNKESTEALKGVAIIAIIFSHICQAAPELKNLLLGGKYSYTIVFTWGGIGVAIFFLLSGYGCYISIGKSINKLTWLITHVTRLLIYFLISYLFIYLFERNTFSTKEWILSFITLKFPGTTSWYFKIQLLFYILLTLSEKLKERQIYLISIFVLMYTIIAKYNGLADYWWKTSLCFIIGCGLAKYKYKLLPIIEKKVTKLILIVIGLGAFIYTRIDFKYIFLPQLVAYICIATCIAITWDWFIGKNKIFIFEKVGKISLPMYLIHIGVVDYIFLLNITNINTKVIIFLIITIIGTFICYLISEYLNKKLLHL